MTIERPEDVDEMVGRFDARGALDHDGIADDVLNLHETLRTCGADPESAGSYRAVIMVVGLLTATHPNGWLAVLSRVGLASMRALRDLKRRDGG